MSNTRYLNSDDPKRRESYEKGLVSAVRQIRDDADRLLEKYEELKDLSYSNTHKSLYEEMVNFIHTTE